MDNEVRVFGPPGTGKTTWLAGSIRKTVEARQTSNILVGSFTRTAAAEIAGRGLPVPPENVGTLHSLAFRAIERPPVHQERILSWNRAHPQLALTPEKKVGALDGPQEYAGATDGDAIFSRLETYRARLVPRHLWPLQVQSFHRRWEAWKRTEGVVDFTDMIELAIHNTDAAPGRPVVGYFDEVQDFTPLELSLVRHWGKQMERVVLAGDDDQCIYAFKGASPDAFLDPPVSADQKWILDQSYRVPRAVHAAAQSWVEQLTRREPKLYRPRDEDGIVRRASFRYTNAEPLTKDIARQVDAGKTVMVLATCGFMLDKVKNQLKVEGLPFHNPYRKGAHDWNPLTPVHGVSSTERLLSYLILDERVFGELARGWTGDDVRRWTSAIKKQGVFKRGAGPTINDLPDRELTYNEVASLFESEDELARAVEPSLDWFRSRLLSGSRGGMEYPIRIAQRMGPRALIEIPRVCLGTIHSVKGGQADVVYLFPDLSLAGMREWTDHGEKRDSVIRQMYVGMTRAKEELVVCQNSTQWTVEPDRLARRS